MYFNNVHILLYLLFGLLGGLIGYLLSYVNKQLAEGKKIFTKDMIRQIREVIKPKYRLIIVLAITYIAILYKNGIYFDISKDIRLIKEMILLPMLISAFAIDYKFQIIPNRLNLTLFETGLIFAFIYGAMSNFNMSINMLLGMFIGGGIFLLITLIGGLIAGKEAMGFGDVKLMGAMGLYLGAVNIVLVTLISFLLGAVISLGLIISKKKKTSEYIPFGPFIVMAAFVITFVPAQNLIYMLLKIFSLGMIKI